MWGLITWVISEWEETKTLSSNFLDQLLHLFSRADWIKATVFPHWQKILLLELAKERQSLQCQSISSSHILDHECTDLGGLASCVPTSVDILKCPIHTCSKAAVRDDAEISNKAPAAAISTFCTYWVLVEPCASPDSPCGADGKSPFPKKGKKKMKEPES